jgi:anti-sigma regulatory factor (Ser/Thr protein kinase)
VAALEASVAEFQSGEPLLDDVAILAVCLGEGAAVVAGEPAEEDPPMRVSVPTRFEALSGARARVRGWLEGMGATPDVVDDLVIAVGEALANAVEHAAGDPGRPLELECRMERGDAVIRVRDRGRWRPPVATPHRGFGLRMIAALTHEASLGYDDGTVLTMRRGILPAGA